MSDDVKLIFLKVSILIICIFCGVRIYDLMSGGRYSKMFENGNAVKSNQNGNRFNNHQVNEDGSKVISKYTASERSDASNANDPLFDLIGDDLVLTGEAAKTVGLTYEQTQALQNSIDSSLRKMAEIAKQHCKKFTDPDGAVSYKIEHLEERSLVMSALKSEMDSIVGKKKADYLYRLIARTHFRLRFGSEHTELTVRG
ncbi:hypothetical protein JIN85_20035 [Luteolibacter pohnpeiensis]|uniref:Uncharacterized protein n=1 Tax=Luteolibacter pohnpeiensis TaxID=454153 RepID=A0A934SEL7_9BACT|nr:hypothetical protein [Luteolibacter pohnpeiensis]MBK1884712.1 hypothetical protein [Luteolibacter pohnpeiensis]